MDVLEEIIAHMQKEELRFFDLYASRQEYKEARKDLQLLKMIRQDPAREDEDFQKQLGYTSSGKNAWYRLRNRLQEDLINSIHLQHVDADEYSRILKLICFARIQIQKSAFKLAFNILRKAEKMAEKAEQYQLLILVYTELVKLSQKSLITDPEPYIQKRRENQKILDQLSRSDEVLAALNYRLVKNQRFSREGKSSLKVLQNLLNENKSDPGLLSSPAFRIRTYQLMSRLLLQRKEFKDLESYLLKTYSEFEKEGIFSRNRHDLKLEMLTWIINTYYSNGRYTDALQKSQELHSAMQAFQGFAYEKYVLFYCNALVINHVGLKQYTKGLQLIEELLSLKKYRISEHYRMMIHINLMYLLYLTHDYRKALRILHKTTLFDSYRTAPALLKVKLDIAGIILNFEAGNTELASDLAEKILKHPKRNSDIPEDDLEFIRIIPLIAENMQPLRDKNILKKVEQLLKSESTSEDIIDFREWLRRTLKMEG